MPMSSTPLTTMSSYRQVAVRLNVCVNTVRAWVKEGHLVPVYLGVRNVRLRDSDVEAFIASRADEVEAGEQQ